MQEFTPHEIVPPVRGESRGKLLSRSSEVYTNNASNSLHTGTR